MSDDITPSTPDPFPTSAGSPYGTSGASRPSDVPSPSGVTSPSGLAGEAGSSSSASSSTAETAKDEAKNVASQAADSGSQVLDTAKAETSEVLAQAGQSARVLFDQVRGELTDQAGTQQQRVASGLHDLANELEEMGRSSQQSGLAASLVKQAADRSRSTAEWMSHREPGDLVSEARRFAARKPGTFLAAAAALGFLGARLTRGLTASTDTTNTGTSGVPAMPVDHRSQPGLSPVTPPGTAGVSGYDDDETLPTVTTMSHGQPVTYPSGDAAAHPRLSPTPPPAPSFRDIGDSTTGAVEGRP